MFATLGSALSLNSQFVPISEQQLVFCPTFPADAKTHSEVRGLVMSTGAAASAASSGRALLVSRDSTIIAELTEWMGRFAISTEVCADVDIAIGLLNQQKFEAIIVDLKLGEQTSALLEKVRLSPANRTAVTFAITDGAAEAPKSEATQRQCEQPRAERRHRHSVANARQFHRGLANRSGRSTHSVLHTRVAIARGISHRQWEALGHTVHGLRTGLGSVGA